MAKIPGTAERPYVKMPLAIPIVCYNGRPVWWPALDLAAMIQVPKGLGLEHLVPHFRHLLIDEHNIPEGGSNPACQPQSEEKFKENHLAGGWQGTRG